MEKDVKNERNDRRRKLPIGQKKAEGLVRHLLPYEEAQEALPANFTNREKAQINMYFLQSLGSGIKMIIKVIIQILIYKYSTVLNCGGIK